MASTENRDVSIEAALQHAKNIVDILVTSITAVSSAVDSLDRRVEALEDIIYERNTEDE